MKLIVAVNNLGYIGKDDKLMWRCSEDLKHFKSTTMGGVLIVGSKTFENDLRGKVLPGREMYIVGNKDKNPLYDSMPWCVGSAYTSRHISSYSQDIWVIGGESIYKQLLPLVEEIHISIINDDTIGDKKFEIPSDYRGKVFTYHFEKNLPPIQD